MCARRWGLTAGLAQPSLRHQAMRRIRTFQPHWNHAAPP